MFKQILPALARNYSRTSAQLLRPLVSRPVSRAAPATQTSRMSSTSNTIYTKNSYAPVGHYSQAFTANGQVWVAGQVALDVEGNKIKGSVKEQADQICKNMSEILKAAGTSLEKVVKINIFTSDMTKIPEFNSVFNDYFPQKPPRTSVEVTRLPLDVEFEVDIIAVI